jgi:hypothetical protein
MIKAIKRNWFEIILVIFILLGVLISLIDLLHNKSLWLDEACLALNIVSRSYLELLTPLADNQSAPIGFLFTEKLLTDVFGSHDWALRIFPFFSFILSIILFFFLNNRLLKSVKAALFSCALFSLNFLLISYSTGVKQYSIDVLVAILIVLSSLRFNKNKNNLSIFLHTCIGAIAIWYSNVAVIVLITAAIYDIYFSLFNNDKNKLSVPISIFIPSFIWLVSFITYYLLFISNHPHTDNMVNYWNSHFLPNNIFSQEFYIFLYDKVRMIFAKLIQTNDLWFIALTFYSIGLFSLIKEKKITYLYILSFPIVVHLTLSFFHLYPFEGRFLLYQIPFVIIPISYGIIFISRNFNNYYVSEIITICLLLTYTYGTFTGNFDEEEIKKSLSYVNTHISSEDHIYVYYSSVPAFKFYKNNYHNIKKENEIHFGGFNRGNPKNYITEIESISGDIWLIFSHMYTEGFPDKPPRTEEQFIIEHLTKKNYIILLDAKFKDSSCYKIRKLN